MMDKNDDRIVIRINSKDKIRMKMYALQVGLSVSELVKVSVMKYISEHEKKLIEEDLK